jgi:hypothetical protein
MKNKYVITLWQNVYDYDGLTSYFFVEIICESLDKAKVAIFNLSHNEISKQLKENEGWRIMDVDGKKQSLFSEGVNKNNKVVYAYETKTGDGSGYNSNYSYYEIIEIPEDVEVDEELFNTADCEWEVKRFFNERTTS